jgi:PPOX class probable F420-dependent enzyme
MAVQIGPRLKAFFDEALPTTVGTARKDGSVQMVPVWYEYRDGQIWLNGGPRRAWVRHMQRDPRVTLLVLDPKNMFRWAQVHGRLAGTTTDAADDHIEHLAQRYTGASYRGPKVDRLIVRIDIDRVTGGESGNPWDATA